MKLPILQLPLLKVKLTYHEWIGDSYALLFSHPKDFTPVCTSELGFAATLVPEFAKRNTKLIGISIDSVEDHIAWSKDVEEVQGTAIDYPMIADTDLTVAKLYNMLPADEEG